MREWFDIGNWPPVDARELNPVIDVEDTSMIHMRLANGVLASYEQCHFTPDYWRNYTVIGTHGRMENFGDTANAEIRLYQRRSDYDPTGTRVVPVPPGDGAIRKDLFVRQLRTREPPFRIFGDSASAVMRTARFGGGLATRKTKEGLQDQILASLSDWSALAETTDSPLGR
jgi:predicted dehydrogenase